MLNISIFLLNKVEGGRGVDILTVINGLENAISVSPTYLRSKKKRISLKRRRRKGLMSVNSAPDGTQLNCFLHGEKPKKY